MDIDEPSYSTQYRADIGEDPATGGRLTELRTLQTTWADLDATPWARVADKSAAADAVRRYHEALVAINELPADDRETALASLGDLSGADLAAVAARVEAAARSVPARRK